MTTEKYQLLPALPPEQFQALKADIAERGVIVPIIVDEFGTIIDGHNRAQACRELGKNDYPTEVRAGLSEEEKRALSRKINALRRHLSRYQVRQLIADQIKETPTWSNNRIAGALGVDDKTVAAVRTNLEATSELPKLDRLTGADGKARLRKQAKRRPSTIGSDDEEDDDAEDTQARGKPEYTAKEWEDLWAGKGKLAEMKKRAWQHAIALMEDGVPSDSPVVAALIQDASIFQMTIKTPNYDPLAGRSDAEKRDWHLYILFQCYDDATGRAGGEPNEVTHHVEWILQRPFQNVAEWLGEEGDLYRSRCRMQVMPETFKAAWAIFLDQHRDWTLPDAIKKLEGLQSEFVAARAHLKPLRQGRRRQAGPVHRS